MKAVYFGLDAVGVLSTGTVFGTLPPSATSLFESLVGTRPVYRLFTDHGSIWTNGSDGGQFTFRVDSLTTAAVLELSTWALWLAQCAAPPGLSRRRRARGESATPA